jgi:hypothetical protein
MALYQATGGNGDSGGNVMKIAKKIRGAEIYAPGRSVLNYQFEILNFNTLRIGSALTYNSPSVAKLQYSYDGNTWRDLISGDKSSATTLDISGHHGETLYMQLDVTAGSQTYATYDLNDVEMYK